MSKRGICLKCEKERAIICRGLCSTCRTREIEAGTLNNNYPAHATRKHSTEKKQPPVRPEGVKDKPAGNDLEDFIKQHNEKDKIKPKTVAVLPAIPPSSTLSDQEGLPATIITTAADSDRELLERIITMAETQRRTPAMQAIHLLDSHPALNGQGVRFKILQTITRLLRL